mmetsp:Transcript_2621/g.4251  ORF Transcript_2621/g.4251 Transcript_2621/m.4251 type:complete len:82 (+) Transcript_2621:1248-1493(+)
MPALRARAEWKNKTHNQRRSHTYAYLLCKCNLKVLAAGREGCQQAASCLVFLSLALGLRQPSIKSTHKELAKVNQHFDIGS